MTLSVCRWLALAAICFVCAHAATTRCVRIPVCSPSLQYATLQGALDASSSGSRGHLLSHHLNLSVLAGDVILVAPDPDLSVPLEAVVVSTPGLTIRSPAAQTKLRSLSNGASRVCDLALDHFAFVSLAGETSIDLRDCAALNLTLSNLAWNNGCVGMGDGAACVSVDAADAAPNGRMALHNFYVNGAQDAVAVRAVANGTRGAAFSCNQCYISKR